MPQTAPKPGWEEKFLTIPVTYKNYISLERKATEISEFTTQVLPGTLQTTAYMQALMHAWVHEFSKTGLEERVLTRQNRQWQVFEREDHPKLRCVVDEGSLLRHIGGREVMHEQLRHIIKLIDSGTIEFRVFPFTEKYGPFVAIPGMTLLQFADRENAMWLENAGWGLFLNGEVEVAQYAYTLERLRDAALDIEQSRQKVLEAIELLYKDDE